MPLSCDAVQNAVLPELGMIRERLASIWSLRRRCELPVRIYYRVRLRGRCRVLHLECVEEFSS
jgi:hypothetical protein